MKHIIIHGGIISEGKLLKVGDSFDCEPAEAKKMGGDACFMEASKHEAMQRASAASKAELAKAGIKPESAKAEKGGK